ncbi:putative MYND finger protein [Lyophyllum shimeji]|uniref:MYND finger protein n=1 Tax=Lyophyllum shimeji TaxID=47721 RepID=A0A9P3PCI0_LYOSH|nr:putative MYND finger protein [Lyophyllum shimeji]
MILTCYYCTKELPSNQMKRCSRCLLVTYCSKECQTISWKASHKQNCKIHPSLVSPDDPNKAVSKAERPEKFTPEWIELEIDRALSRWMQLWRSCFQMYAWMCLDLANHPRERVMTHCMQLIVQPRNFEDDPAKQYFIVEASVVSIADVQARHPTLEVTIDPTDYTRMRFVVIMQNHLGEARRLRLVQWNDIGLEKKRQMDKADSASLGGDSPDSPWVQTLISAVDSMSPSEVEKMFGKKRS